MTSSNLTEEETEVQGSPRAGHGQHSAHWPQRQLLPSCLEPTLLAQLLAGLHAETSGQNAAEFHQTLLLPRAFLTTGCHEGAVTSIFNLMK